MYAGLLLNKNGRKSRGWNLITSVIIPQMEFLLAARPGPARDCGRIGLVIVKFPLGRKLKLPTCFHGDDDGNDDDDDGGERRR